MSVQQGTDEARSGLNLVKPSLKDHLRRLIVPRIDYEDDEEELLQQQAWQPQTCGDPLQDVSLPLTAKSLGFIPKTNAIRKACIYCMHTPLFEHIMLLAIVANCITLAMDSNRPAFEETQLARSLKVSNYFFIAMFTTEALVKILALGFVSDPNTYLRDGWNRLDFLVVAVSFLDFTSIGNFTALRSIRVLRPLRTINKVPQMKLIVNTLIKSLPMLSDVLVLAGFYFIVFGVAMLQLYSGRFSSRCGVPQFEVDSITGQITNVTYVVPSDQQGDVCSGPVTKSLTWANVSYSKYAVAFGAKEETGGRTCAWNPGPLTDEQAALEDPYGMFCTHWGSPSTGGNRDFDNILKSWLSVFQVITMTDWTFIMYDAQDALNWWVWPLHVFMVLLGPFFIISLALAVLFLFFTKDRKKQEAHAHDEAARKKLEEEAEQRVQVMQHGSKLDPHAVDKALAAAHAAAAAGADDSLTSGSKDTSPGHGVGRGIPEDSSSADDNSLSNDAARRAVFSGPRNTAGLDVIPQQQQQQNDSSSQQGQQGADTSAVPTSHVNHTNSAHQQQQLVQERESRHDLPVHRPSKFRIWVNHVIRHRGFEITCTSVIVMNAVVMALIWYEMPSSIETATNNLNYAFTMFFVLEMAMKLYGLGVKRYVSDSMNTFDGIVTVAGFVEMILDLSSAASLGSYLSVLRAFRLLRIFRLARSWTSLNRIIKVLLASIKAVSWLIVLLMLFLFIWALLGTQFFGYSLADCDAAVSGSFQTCPPGLSPLHDCPAVQECYVKCSADTLGTWFAVDGSPYGGQAYCEQFPRSYDSSATNNDPSWPVYLAQVGKPATLRANYDDMYTSIITVFQLLTLDNWADVMHTSMTLISAPTALFYVALIVIGCYMLLNLFLAILLDNLEQITEKDATGSLSDPGSLSGSGPGAMNSRNASFGDAQKDGPVPTSVAADVGSFGPMGEVSAAGPTQLHSSSVADNKGNISGHGRISGGQGDKEDKLQWQDQDVRTSLLERVSQQKASDAAPDRSSDDDDDMDSDEDDGVVVDKHGMKMRKLTTLNTSFWVPHKKRVGGSGKIKAGVATPSDPDDTVTLTPGSVPGGDAELEPSSSKVLDDVVAGKAGDKQEQEQQVEASPRSLVGIAGLHNHRLSPPQQSAAAAGSPRDPSRLDGAATAAAGNNTQPHPPTHPSSSTSQLAPIAVGLSHSTGGDPDAHLMQSILRPYLHPDSLPGRGGIMIPLTTLPSLNEYPPGSSLSSLPDIDALMSGQMPSWFTQPARPSVLATATSSATPDLRPLHGALPAAAELDRSHDEQQHGHADQHVLHPSPPTAPMPPPPMPPPISTSMSTPEHIADRHSLESNDGSSSSRPLTAPSKQHYGNRVVPFPQSGHIPDGHQQQQQQQQQHLSRFRPEFSDTLPASGPSSSGGVGGVPQRIKSSLKARGSSTGWLAGESDTCSAAADVSGDGSGQSPKKAQRRGVQFNSAEGASPSKQFAVTDSGLSVTGRLASGMRPLSAARPLGGGGGGGGVDGDVDVAVRQKSFASRMMDVTLNPMIMSRPGSALHKSGHQDTAPGQVNDEEEERQKVRIADILHGDSCYVFKRKSTVRMWAARIVANRYFEQAIIALIFVSSIQLAIDGRNVEQGSRLDLGLHILDIIFCVVFGIEMVLKMLVMGVVANGPGSYLRSPWNCLDAAIVAVQVAVLVLEALVDMRNLSGMRAIRALRVMRVLRAAHHIEGIRVVVTAVLKAIPAVADVVLVGLLFYFIFSVLAVNLLMGGMFYCKDADGGNQLDAYYVLPSGQSINKAWCLQGSYVVNSSYYHSSIGVDVPSWEVTTAWVAPLTRFDNVAQAVFTLFQMSTLEGWSDTLHATQDIVGPGEQPVENANQYIAIFFILFIFVCSFFMLNLVVGVSIDKFHQMKEEAGGASLLLTEQQQQWLNIQKLLTATRPTTHYSPPDSKWRKPAYALVYGNTTFDKVIMGVIVMNIAAMCMVHADQNDGWTVALSVANVVFTAVFTAEMILKWIAAGVKPYFSDNWNRLDCFVVVVSIVGVLVDYLVKGQQLTWLPLLRILRIARMFRLIPKARGLQLMLSTLMWSIPALVNVGTMLFLFMFMYSIVGMSLFGNIKFQENLNRHANFKNFPNAMLTLFRSITGENWNLIMQDCMVRESCLLVLYDYKLTTTDAEAATITRPLAKGDWLDQGDPDVRALPGDLLDDQCSVAPVVSVLFFGSFMLLCSYLLLQLVIAVVLDNVQEQYEMEEMVIHQDHLWSFVDTWETLDVHGDGFISVHELTALLEAVPAPLGVRGLEYGPKRVMEIVLSSDIPLHTGLRVHFLEAMHALAGRVAGAELPKDAEFKIHDKLVAQLPKDTETIKYSACHYYAAMYVKAAIKGFLARRMIAPLWDAMEAEEEAAKMQMNGKSSAPTNSSVAKQVSGGLKVESGSTGGAAGDDGADGGGGAGGAGTRSRITADTRNKTLSRMSTLRKEQRDHLLQGLRSLGTMNTLRSAGSSSLQHRQEQQQHGDSAVAVPSATAAGSQASSPSPPPPHS